MSACHTLKYSDFKIPSQLHAKNIPIHTYR